MDDLLYRGVNFKLHAECSGELRPKESKPFSKAPEFGSAEFGNSFWGDNEENAVVEHQLHQKGYPTSGISTTPIIERAGFYATHDRKYVEGLIYIIDRKICVSLGVSIYIVSDIVPMPSIPEDKEVILVAANYGPLPKEVIVEIRRCNNSGDFNKKYWTT